MKGTLLLLFAYFIFPVCAQSDSVVVETDSVKPHSVKKAVIFSAVLPGAGQVYNHMAMPKGKKKAYWKVPLIYAGLGASGYFLVTNQSEQKALKEEYTNRQDDPLYVGPEKYQPYDDSGILTLYNQYLNWRDLSILAVAGVYILQVVDAGVEAHFVHFDISDDLSLNFEPTLLNYNTAGLKMTLNFH